MHYYKRSTSDYMAQARGLSLAEMGAYVALVDAYYRAEHPPSRAEALFWVGAKKKREIAVVDSVLAKFFVKVGNQSEKNECRFHIKTIDEDIERYQANSLINKRIAVEREAARRVQAEQKPSTDRAPNQELRTSNQELQTKNLKTYSGVVASPSDALVLDAEPKNSGNITALSRSPRKARAVPLPDDFEPDDQGYALARQCGLTSAEVLHFCDYWRANGKCKCDWQATWRNWCRRAPAMNARFETKQSRDEQRADWIAGVTTWGRGGEHHGRIINDESLAIGF